MQSFIVLGIIPGTNFQLNFSFWISVGITLLCLPILRALWRKRASLYFIVAAVRISWVIDQYQLQA
jgi:hypothetical protein